MGAVTNMTDLLLKGPGKAPDAPVPPPPPPPPPTSQAPQGIQAASAAANAAAQARGPGSTIITGPQGLTEPASTTKKALTGS